VKRRGNKAINLKIGMLNLMEFEANPPISCVKGRGLFFLSIFRKIMIKSYLQEMKFLYRKKAN
jgi:hypothetical protein